jgi:hypothetical protein
MIFFISICLDGAKFLPIQLATFNQLKIPWKWIIIEGTAAPVGCTSWVAEMPPRLSNDGSTEWLTEARRYHPNVIHMARPSWQGKLEMFNYAMSIVHDQQSRIKAECPIVFECDLDELWKPEQLTKVWELFLNCPAYNRMQFNCQYHLGPNVVVTSDDTYGNHHAYEWYRAWRYHPRFQFLRHEAPEVNGPAGKTFDWAMTQKMGLRFIHQAYFYESQAEWKEKYYKYHGALEQWRALQANKEWPTKAKDFLRWITDETTVDLLNK